MAIGVSSVMRYTAPSVKALCEQHGLDGVPIGIDRGAQRKGFFCLYQKKLAAYCRSGFTNGDCPEAYRLCRSALSSAPEKAAIVDVGFPQIVMELLRSGPDEYSGLSGILRKRSRKSFSWAEDGIGIPAENITSALIGSTGKPRRIFAGAAPYR